MLAEIFWEYPDPTVRTMYATYRGAAGFEATYPGTAERNVGSQMQPAYPPDLCDCGDPAMCVAVSITPNVTSFEATLARIERELDYWPDAARWTPELAEAS